MNERGFTLLETLVAIALLGLVTLVLGAAIDFAVSGRRAAETAADSSERLRLAQQVLRQRIELALPLTAPGAVRPILLFEGSASRLRFLADIRRPGGERGLNILDIGLGDDGLVIARAPWQPGSASLQAAGQIERSVLLSDATSFRLAYYGSATEGGAVGWQRDWRDAERLPAMIRVELAWPGGDWPPLMIAPALSAVPR
ncbi:prepilin-type N-terminal cleavage/methylation domain-containing protein [Oceanibacterium hippocampi]|uniref:General secretion pathway protein J n=1 Tax=Oceanibacterium hippocampi TaxID=745714 RepID=A0A1Y5T734_9PROT|nr:prepilin-type N-terminal cleavage/methylation domain-containing protein [Oceanibacterium hippocampi]SLN56883.1 general secretion pathway protein J [Oceanibacterium hippocampi]